MRSPLCRAVQLPAQTSEVPKDLPTVFAESNPSQLPLGLHVAGRGTRFRPQLLAEHEKHTAAQLRADRADYMQQIDDDAGVGRNIHG